MKKNRGFRHHNALIMIAVIGVIVAMIAPSLAEYLEQHESGSPYWFKFGVILVVTTLFVFFIVMLIFLFLTRDTPTKEQRIRNEQEERCADLIGRAFASCQAASADAEGNQKTWKKPKNTLVEKAIWGIQPVENPELFEILFDAWKAGDRDTELALHLMYASWDLWEQCYDYHPQRHTDLGDQVLITAFQQPYEYLGGHQSENPTLLLTASHMIFLFDYQTGLTLNDAELCLERFLEICPEGIPDAEFEGRGDFGDYFNHIIGYQKQE
jgi:hypothetical protein